MNTTFRNILLLVLVAFVGLPTIILFAQNKSSGSKFIRKYRKNVIQITAHFSNGETRDGFGFVIAKGLYIATANHVVRHEDPDVRAKKINVVFFAERGRSRRAVLLNLFSSRDELDLALLKVKPPTRFRWERKNYCPELQRSTPVWFIGRKRKWFTPVRAGEVNQVDRVRHRIQVEISSVRRGTSGAPLLSRDGFVGMVVLDREKNEAVAVSIESIREKVHKQWGIPWGLQRCSRLGASSIIPLPKIPPLPAGGSIAQLNIVQLKLLQAAKRSEKDQAETPRRRARLWKALANHKGKNPYRAFARKRSEFWFKYVEKEKARARQLYRLFVQRSVDQRKFREIKKLDKDVMTAVEKLRLYGEIKKKYDPFKSELLALESNFARATKDCGEMYGLQALAPWAMRGYCGTHQGRSPFVGPRKQPLEIWKRLNGSNPVVAVDGTIYFSITDGAVLALRRDGKSKWGRRIQGRVSASLALATDGTIYIVSRNKHLYAVNSDGSTKWIYKAGAKLFSSPVVGSEGTIYFGSSSGHLHAVHSDGSRKWKRKIGGSLWSSPALSRRGTIYVGSWDNHLYAVNSNGSPKWKFPTGGNVNSSPVIARDETIYFGSSDKKFYAVSKTGKLKWSFSTGGPIVGLPALSGKGIVYFTSQGGYLYALHPNGKKKWSFRLGKNPGEFPTVTADGTILIGASDQKLYALNPDGSQKWVYNSPVSTRGTIAVTPDGTIITGDGALIAIGD